MIASESRVCVITGVLGGIGQAVSAAFVDAGWRVVGLDAKAGAARGVIDCLQLDISDSTAVSQAADYINGKYRGLDALINNAAVLNRKALLQTSDEEWRTTIETNLSGAFYCTRAFHSALRGNSGAIVNMSSVHALATSENMGAYAVSKAALIALTRATALEFAADGIRCNAVLPGAVDTPMLWDGRSTDVGVDGLQRQAETLRRLTPLGRIASPEEIAPVVLHLADNRWSSYTTGATLVIDGGATLRLATE